MQGSPFEIAVERVQAWLDHGQGSAWARRDTEFSVARGVAWNIKLENDELPIKSVRLVLPPGFPANPCEMYVDHSQFLRLPHVEANGHVCLDVVPIPNDYDDPVSAIQRALTKFKDQLLNPSKDIQWVQQQFQAECGSYWAQAAIQRAGARGRPSLARRTYVYTGPVDRWTSGSLVGYFIGSGKSRTCELQVATMAATDPHELATRHGWATGTMTKGDALFVALSEDAIWTPATWPKSFAELEALITRITNHECSIARWIQKAGVTRSGRGHRAGQSQTLDFRGDRTQRLLVLALKGSLFGYQIFASTAPAISPPTIEPVFVTRVDPDWGLARDHELQVLRARRKKRVLLLGCGSLGSPVAKALARAGVGHLDMVDLQLMESENTARHELGLAEIGFGKAQALAQRLRREVPGIEVHGFQANAADWMAQNCKPDKYDLVIECTAESSVRTFISHARSALLGSCPVIHAWTEPLCSAGHVVLTRVDVPWPADDPADDLVNASDLSASDTRIDLPACSGDFHPYGAADIDLIAAFAAERVIAVLDTPEIGSTVWSWCRSTAFFESLPIRVATRAIVPVSASKFDSAATTRDLAGLLSC